MYSATRFNSLLFSGHASQVTWKNRTRQLYKFHRFILQYFIGADDKNLQLLEIKTVFCYDYIDSFERLTERQLPLWKRFFNRQWARMFRRRLCSRAKWLGGVSVQLNYWIYGHKTYNRCFSPRRCVLKFSKRITSWIPDWFSLLFKSAAPCLKCVS